MAYQQHNQHFEECCTGRLARQFTSLGKKNRPRKGRYLGLAPISKRFCASTRASDSINRRTDIFPLLQKKVDDVYLFSAQELWCSAILSFNQPSPSMKWIFLSAAQTAILNEKKSLNANQKIDFSMGSSTLLSEAWEYSYHNFLVSHGKFISQGLISLIFHPLSLHETMSFS